MPFHFVFRRTLLLPCLSGSCRTKLTLFLYLGPTSPERGLGFLPSSLLGTVSRIARGKNRIHCRSGHQAGPLSKAARHLLVPGSARAARRSYWSEAQTSARVTLSFSLRHRHDTSSPPNSPGDIVHGNDERMHELTTAGFL